MKNITHLALFIFFLCMHLGYSQDASLRNKKIDGYKGIWFELNQKYEYGDKYSGGLGTYTAKHIPIAIYAPEVDKTFFVYGGTTHKNEKHLLSMIGVFDHKNKTVSKPTVVYDKIDVDDPHDNPSLLIDDGGYIWVFVSGRGTRRAGIKLKSIEPYSISEFKIISEEEFTYPQIWNTKKGFFHFFTKYSGVRELYFETSYNGIHWSETEKLAEIKSPEMKKSGHYQVSNHFNNGEIIGTFFNRHINGHPDTRTDLYYLQSKNNGETWEDIQENKSKIPLKEVAIKERVINYHSKNKNVYLKDMRYDSSGNPVCLYLISNGHEPGPENKPYQWCVTSWNGEKWNTTIVCESDHNYDMGSLYIKQDIWTIVGPTENGPQEYGAGGEIVIWKSIDKGQHWKKELQVTKNSGLNHSYVRRPINYKPPFCFFWATGDTEKMSTSELYFGDFKGNIWKLPYHMNNNHEKPLKVK